MHTLCALPLSSLLHTHTHTHTLLFHTPTDLGEGSGHSGCCPLALLSRDYSGSRGAWEVALDSFYHHFRDTVENVVLVQEKGGCEVDPGAYLRVPDWTLALPRKPSTRSCLSLEEGPHRVPKHKNRELLPDQPCKPDGPAFPAGVCPGLTSPVTCGHVLNSNSHFSLHQAACVTFFSFAVVANVLHL